ARFPAPAGRTMRATATPGIEARRRSLRPAARGAGAAVRRGADGPAGPGAGPAGRDDVAAAAAAAMLRADGFRRTDGAARRYRPRARSAAEAIDGSAAAA